MSPFKPRNLSQLNEARTFQRVNLNCLLVPGLSIVRQEGVLRWYMTVKVREACPLTLP